MPAHSRQVIIETGEVSLESADSLLAKTDPKAPFGLNGIEMNSENELIVAHASNKELLKISEDGKVSKITGLPMISGDGILFVDSVLLVTDLDSGTVYNIKIEGVSGRVVSEQNVSLGGIVSCTVNANGEIYALAAYIDELFAGKNRTEFPLIKIRNSIDESKAHRFDSPFFMLFLLVLL